MKSFSCGSCTNELVIPKVCFVLNSKVFIAFGLFANSNNSIISKRFHYIPGFTGLPAPPFYSWPPAFPVIGKLNLFVAVYQGYCHGNCQ